MALRWASVAVALLMHTAGCAAKEGPCTLFNVRRADLLSQQELQQGVSKPFPMKPSNQKHTPYMRFADKRATVTVGLGTVSGNTKDPVHPTVAKRDPKAVHFITTIYAVDQDDQVVAMAELLGTTERPSLVFDVPAGTTHLTPYAFCNRHGLFAGERVRLELEDVGSEPVSCVLASCGENTAGEQDGACLLFSAFEAEALRRHVAELQEILPFAPTPKNKKHTPVITFTGTRAVVAVGDSPVHPTVASSKPSSLHYIHSVYVKNQANRVVAVGTLSPLDTPPVMHFEVPAGTTSLTAYALCNKHGLHQGQATQVPPNHVGSGPIRCAAAVCLGAPVVNAAPAVACEGGDCQAEL